MTTINLPDNSLSLKDAKKDPARKKGKEIPGFMEKWIKKNETTEKKEN